MGVLSNYQFSFHPNVKQFGDNVHEVHVQDPAYKGPAMYGGVGYMEIHPESGVIYDVVVNEQHRRKGVATAMWDLAHSIHQAMPDKYPKPVHSAIRTDKGDAWAHAVGGDVPPRATNYD
jgi:hypothetical protein